ncbi:MAG TPA: cytoplasmic protein [Paenibacillaceae bacterium]|nr:cytoplasmic protein [Paenibacillaceae bacterium]
MEYSDAVKNRLKRIEGQVRGVLRMMEEEKECKDVITQLSAVRSAVDRAILFVVGSNMEICLRQQIENGADTDEVLNEAIQLLLKSR